MREGPRPRAETTVPLSPHGLSASRQHQGESHVAFTHVLSATPSVTLTVGVTLALRFVPVTLLQTLSSPTQGTAQHNPNT